MVKRHPPDRGVKTDVEASSSVGDSDTLTPFTLGEGLPPVQKIQHGDHMDMVELLCDNTDLECRKASRESTPGFWYMYQKVA